MRKKAKFVVGLVGLMLLAMLSLIMLSAARVYDGAESSSRRNEDDSFRPSVWKPASVDRDNNGIADSLDREIAGRSANSTTQDYVNVTVMLKSEPTARDADDFVSSGGYLTTSPWTRATYGFGGRIPYSEIRVFAQRCPDVLLVEEEAVCHSSVAYAATQVGARTYVWSGLGLQGDSNSSVAVLDTGIDASHPDFSPGFGDQNFSEKIVGWNDQISGAISPFDDNGHGSHVSGLAAGDGFFSVDASGNAIDTWGASLGSVSSTGTYLISGMMVNKTGMITLKVKWTTTGTAKLSALPLYYGDKTLNSGFWVRAASVSTPSQNTWYTLTYDVVSTPSGGYDMYHAMMNLTRGRGNLYVVLTMSWPYTPPADGFSAWTGIAPQAKLVGVKVLDYSGSGTSTGLINGINWIIANRMSYHITVASMSLGFGSEVSAVDTAVVNLVNSGVTTVVAAGNSGPGGNYVYSPGSVDEALTVAAMNQFDNTASYSSQGGTSRYTGVTTKPDVTAPGGSFLGVPLLSADSNSGDAEGEWPDVQADDAAPMQGTSMATPIVAGAADIVIQAMGGYSNWQWTRSQALQPKMILLMTATETYPNLREQGSLSASPTLDRGGKDVHEGYGRLNLDAAADAVLRTYQVGTTVTDVLGKPPTLSDISVLGQRLAWARNVQLVSGLNYSFTLNVPAGADYDLYLYNSTGNTFGGPAIVASSTIAASGGTEQFTVAAPYTGTYYLVVKRATETTGSGAFIVTSAHANVRTWYWTSDTVIKSVAFGDVDGDGKIETVTGGYYWDGSRYKAQLCVWDGATLALKNVQTWYWTGNTSIYSVAVRDVNGDGKSEIVTGGSFYDGTRDVAQVCMWDGATLVLKNVETWYWTGDTRIGSVAVGDVDADGKVEIVTGGFYYDGFYRAQLCVWDGATLALKGVRTWYWTGNTSICSVGVGDVDADGKVEIVTGGYYDDGARLVAQLCVWDGATLALTDVRTWYWTGNTSIYSVAVSDVDGDGKAEIVTGGSYNDGTRDVAQVCVWDGATFGLENVQTWYWTGDTRIGSVAVGDVDADGKNEIVTGGVYYDGLYPNGLYKAQLCVWDGATLALENVKAWYWTGDTGINAVAVGAIYGDGKSEIVTGGSYYDGTRDVAQLCVWG